MVELAHSICLKPGNLIPEKSIKHGKAFLGQRPIILDICLEGCTEAKRTMCGDEYLIALLVGAPVYMVMRTGLRELGAHFFCT